MGLKPTKVDIQHFDLYNTLHALHCVKQAGIAGTRHPAIMYNLQCTPSLLNIFKLGANQGGQYRERQSTRHALLRHIILVLFLYIISVKGHPKCSLFSLHYVKNIINQFFSLANDY